MADPQTVGVAAVDFLVIATRIGEIISTETAGYLAATNKRQYVIDFAQKLWDEYGQPLDLPGPDNIEDPVIRVAIGAIAGVLYDAAAAKLTKPAV